MKRILQSSPNWEIMADDQREALEMVAHKIGRILNGDPNYPDSWHDIAGYAQLVDARLAGPEAAAVKAEVERSFAEPESAKTTVLPTAHKLPEAPVPPADAFRVGGTAVTPPAPALAPAASVAPPVPVAVTAPAKKDPSE